jgi:hypothetical protein
MPKVWKYIKSCHTLGLLNCNSYNLAHQLLPAMF